MTPHALAGTLISHAAGLTSDAAAAELICAHHTWLARAEFVTGYIDAGTRHDGHPYALGSPEPSGLRTSSRVHPERVGCKWPAGKRISRLNSATRLPGRLWIIHGPLPRWRAESA